MCVPAPGVFEPVTTGTVRLCDPCVRVSRVCVPAPPGSVRFFTVRFFTGTVQTSSPVNSLRE